jgi:hypothetical protein
MYCQTKRLKVRERERMEGEFLRKKRRGQIGASDFLFKAPKARKILSLKGDRERVREGRGGRGGGGGPWRWW